MTATKCKGGSAKLPPLSFEPSFDPCRRRGLAAQALLPGDFAMWKMLR
jgi:hypothetical protein